MNKNKFSDVFFAVIFIAAILLYVKISNVTKIHFICNNLECSFKYINSFGRINSEQNIKITDIKEFTYKYERKIPNLFLTILIGPKRKSLNKYYYIYAKRKDNSEYRIKRFPIKKEYYKQVTELVDKLNDAIKEKPINIDMYFCKSGISCN